ncbi:hypothetical protein [Crocosphaera sp. Alani8]|uniref:hypothetical protein n=1 Tax=Crocosphaera sp. Alani8 TaxID=3038952 RepID=UPI00313CFD75
MTTTSSEIEIRIFGARNAGKTTYLATLAACPSGLKEKYAGIEVIPRSTETKDLADLAEDILKKKAKIAPTIYDAQQQHNLPYYDFLIKIPGNEERKKIDIELTTRDFPGEFFENIPRPDKQQEIQTWIDELFTTTRWMIMMTDWEPNWDKSVYKPAFEKLCQELSEREENNPELKNVRIAVVMNKCERGELWPCRLDPDEDLFEVRLPETYKLLTKKLSPKRLEFFACSAFGILCDRREGFDPRPNCYLPDDGTPEEIKAYLRNPGSWYPYGLIPPLYWLATGIRLEE